MLKESEVNKQAIIMELIGIVILLIYMCLTLSNKYMYMDIMIDRIPV